MSYTYAQFQAALQNATDTYDSTGAEVISALAPTIVDYAEGRIYRDAELDLISIRYTDTSQTTVAGSRTVSFPPNIMVVEEVDLITPAGASLTTGTKVPLLRVSRSFIHTTWPMETQTAPPQPFQTYFAITGQVWTPQTTPPTPIPTGSDNHLILAPTPDNAYIVSMYGILKPTPLYALPAGQMSVLSLVYPELFFAAAMVAACGVVLKNYSAIADDPQSAITWEAQYQALRKAAVGESARQKSQAPGWAASSIPTIATIPRFGSQASVPPQPPIAGVRSNVSQF